MTLNEAIKIADEKAKEFGFSVIPSCDTTNYYVFLPVTKNKELIGNSSSIIVNKRNNKAKLVTFFDLKDGEEVLEDYPI